MNYRDPELRELLSAQYVLGTLKPRARRRFESLLPGRADLRRSVAGWERRLPELLGPTPAIEAPDSVWPKLRTRLFPETLAAAPATTASPAPGLLARLSFWRGWAAMASVVAFVFALALGLGKQTAIPGYASVGTSMQSHEPMWMLSAAPEMDRIYVKSIQPMVMSPDIGCLLWIRPEGSERMILVGELPWRGEEATLKIDKATRAQLKGQLVVTVERVDRGMPDKPTAAPKFAGSWMPIRI